MTIGLTTRTQNNDGQTWGSLGRPSLIDCGRGEICWSWAEKCWPCSSVYPSLIITIGRFKLYLSTYNAFRIVLARVLWTLRRLVVEKAFLVKLFPLLNRREIQEVVTYIPRNLSGTWQAPANKKTHTVRIYTYCRRRVVAWQTVNTALFYSSNNLLT